MQFSPAYSTSSVITAALLQPLQNLTLLARYQYLLSKHVGIIARHLLWLAYLQFFLNPVYP